MPDHLIPGDEIMNVRSVSRSGKLHRSIAGGLTLIASLAATATQPATAASKEDKAVLGAVQTMLDAWREADASKLDSVLHEQFREVTLHLKDGQWEFSPFERAKLVGVMGKITRGDWDDHLLAPQVHVDGPIAVVWSRYRFAGRYVEDGVEHHPVHCGIETFQLYRVDGAWKIVNFADTHSDTCS
jgi:hypothetical protein